MKKMGDLVTSVVATSIVLANTAYGSPFVVAQDNAAETGIYLKLF